MIIINITSFCNKKGKCPYCLNFDLVRGDNKKEINVEKIEQLLQQGKLKEEWIGLSGGEPTTHSNLEDIIDYLTKHGKKVIIATNLEQYRRIKPNKSLYWQLSLHLEEVEKRLENAKKYIKEGHNINCFLVPIYQGNFNKELLKKVAKKCYSLSPIIPLFFRYLGDTPYFKNNLDPKELNAFICKEIKNNYHPYSYTLYKIENNNFL